MRPVVCALALILATSVPAGASEALDRLVTVLRLGEVVEILRDEGLAYGRTLDTEMLDGTGGTHFAAQVRTIYDAQRMLAAMRAALDAGMTPAHMAATIDFFDTDLGQKILSLENSARRTFADPDIEAAARALYDGLPADDPRLGRIRDYIETNDLIAQNVDGSISADFSFYRGLAEGHGGGMDDASTLADLFGRRDETRSETESWLFGFLLFAYRPLSDSELDRNIAFSATPAGQALNAALFEGFDQVYDRISYDLGQAVAFAEAATDL